MKIKSANSRLVNSNRVYPFIFFSIIVYFIVANLWWFIGNNSVEDISTQFFLYFSTQFFYRMQQIVNDFTISLWNKFQQVFYLLRFPIEHSIKVWPQFVYFSSYPFYLVGGASLLMARLTMVPYFVILLISVFYIGKIISSRFTGFFAVVLTMMYPLIFESFRQFGVHGLHFPLTAMVSLSILLLIKCNDFVNFKYSLALGICVGIGMLIGGQLVLFIGIPILFTIINAIKGGMEKHKLSFRSVLRNILLFLIIAFSISWLWWGSNFKAGFWYLKMQILDPKMWRLEGWTGMERFSFSTITWHIRDLFLNSLGPGLCIAFLPSLYFIFKKPMMEKYLYINWLFVPLFLFSFAFAIKQNHLLLPILPIIAIFTAWWIDNLSNEKVKTIIIFSILLYTVTQFSFLTFADMHFRGGVQGKNKFFGGTYYGDIKRSKDLKIDEVTKTIKRLKSGNKEVNILSICLVKGSPYDFEILYWLTKENRNFKAIDFTQMFRFVYNNFDLFDFILLKIPADKNYSNIPSKSEFIELLKNGLINSDYFSRQHSNIWLKLIDNFCGSQKTYKLVADIIVSCDYRWLVFKKR